MQSLFRDIPPTVCVPGSRFPDGQPRTFINPNKLYQKSFWLRSTAATVAANGSAITDWTPPRDRGTEGDAALYYLTAESSGQFAVRLESNVLDRKLMNRPVESSLIFGHGNLPAVLTEPLFVPSSSSINIELTDLSGSSNTVSLVAIGSQLLKPRTDADRQEIAAQAYKHPFWLTTDDGAQVTVGANQTSTFELTVPGDAHFLATRLLYRSTGDCDIELVEGSRRSLMSTGAVMPIPLVAAQTLSVTGFPGSLVPAAATPMMLPFSHLFEKKTALTLRVTDTSGSSNTISAALAGQLLYFDQLPAGIDPRTLGV